MDSGNVLVVDDEPNVCRLVKAYLEKERFNVRTANDGRAALDIARNEDFDLILLDLMLPEIDGWEVCKVVRQESDTPVIILSARGGELDRVLGFELGADDYVTKPFSPRELVLRVKAVLKRSKVERTRTLRFPDFLIDEDKRQVWVHDQEVIFTRKEFDLLWFFAINEGRAFDRDQLLEQVWGFDYVGDVRTIDVHVTRLREKLRVECSPYTYIHTVWDIGYKFEIRKDEDA